MSDRTPIEWTDATWNPLRGCSRVSQGCVNCYAEVMAARFSGPGQWGEGLAQMVRGPGGKVDHRWTGKVVLAEDQLDQPLRWRRPRRIFVNSTSDLFHESVPDDWIDRIFAVMALCPQHTFQVLTKRPEWMRQYMRDARERVMDIVCDRACDEDWPVLLVFPPNHIPPDSMSGRRVDITAWPLPNVWLGTSAEDQATADARIPDLLATPAAVRFLSAEPLLGPLDLERAWHGDSALEGECWGECAWCDLGYPPMHNCQKGRQSSAALSKGRDGLDWVITGGESGPGARPMHPDWARSLRDQCVAAGVPFFFKQWGEWEADEVGPEDKRSIRHPPGSVIFRRVGKKAAGRKLGGRTWDEMPGLRAA